jgi:hypothetical protein
MANRRFIDFPIASTVGENDIVLIWQSGANKQTTKATLLSGVAKQLNDLTDVTITSLANGQILQYDSVTNQWINVDRTDIDLSELGDVSIISPANGQVLVYNSATAKWENSSGGYVPYVGAVTTVNLGLQGLEAGFIRLDTSITSPPTGQGTMYWDQDEETVAIILNGSTTKVGEDIFFQVKNQSGSTIPKGTAVRFDGIIGASGRVKIVPFIANGSNPSIYFLGVTYEAIADGGDGKALFNGKIRGVNTSSFAVGDILYASPTVAGGFTTTKPVAPNNIISVAAVLSSGANGILLIRPQIGSNINNDEGVKITSPTTGDLLQLQASGLWENKSVASLSLVPQSRTLTINGTAFDLSADRTWSIPVHDAVTIGTANGLSLSGQVLSLGLASGSANGALSSTNWTTFNNKIGGSGTTNYIAKFTAAGTVGDSGIFESGGNVGIGMISPSAKLQLIGQIMSGTSGFDSGSIGYTGLGSFNNSTAIENIDGLYLRKNTGDGSSISISFGVAGGSEYFVGSRIKHLRTGVNSNGHLVFETKSDSSINTTIEKMRITSSGNVLIGTTTARNTGGAERLLQVEGTTNFPGISAVRNSADAGGPNIVIGKSRATSNGGVTIVQNGDNIGSVSFVGANGVDLNSYTAVISSQVDGTPSSTSMPGVLIFLTTAAGAITPTERMRIFSDGNVFIGSSPSNAGFKLDVNGSLRANTRVNFSSLPTSSSGLVSGDLWRNGTVINIVA